jgi:hypothetical protein
MNTARIVVQAIAVGAGGDFPRPGGRPHTASPVTGAIAQVRQTRAQSPTLQGTAYGHLAGQTGDRASERLERVNIAPRHANPATMRN